MPTHRTISYIDDLYWDEFIHQPQSKKDFSSFFGGGRGEIKDLDSWKRFSKIAFFGGLRRGCQMGMGTSFGKSGEGRWR